MVWCVRLVLGPEDRHRERVDIVVVDFVGIATPALAGEATAFIHVLLAGIEGEDFDFDTLQSRCAKRMLNDELTGLGAETADAPCGADENSKAAAVIVRPYPIGTPGTCNQPG
jgi:uncharacterized protein YaiI (UPF0178 family)